MSHIQKDITCEEFIHNLSLNFSKGVKLHFGIEILEYKSKDDYLLKYWHEINKKLKNFVGLWDYQQTIKFESDDTIFRISDNENLEVIYRKDKINEFHNLTCVAHIIESYVDELIKSYYFHFSHHFFPDTEPMIDNSSYNRFYYLSRYYREFSLTTTI